MRQLQFEYKEKTFEKEIRRLSKWSNKSMESAVVFDIYTTLVDSEKIDAITSVIARDLPNAIYRGCTTNGNILHGDLSKDSTCIICTIYEYPDTKVDVLQYRFTQETEKSIVEDLRKYIEKNPWVKAIDMLVTIRGMSMTSFCEDLSTLREDIHIYGGGALSADINEDRAYVFSSKGKCSDKSVVFLMLGGDDLDIVTTHITGWKPLGRELHVTSADGMMLHELDNRPAYDTYYHFLKIKNDDHFFENTLEFPFFFELNGLNLLRAPTACEEDGTLVMTADMAENVKARIAYGDPRTILDSIKESCIGLKDFQPEAIHAYSCAARRTFWGSEIFKETQPMQSMAPTSGFYTSGEFLRTGKNVNLHNVTLVLAALREGRKREAKQTSYDFEQEEITGNVSMITRLANFIEAATEELEIMAVTDGLTGLYNRREIQRKIDNDIEKHPKHFALIMIDADDFKKVNDLYGHDIGDTVLTGLSATIQKNIKGFNAEAGRWGGEEFMICVTGHKEKEVCDLAEKIRLDYAGIDFKGAGHQTISLGVTFLQKGETADSLCKRADKALYGAKYDGKNRVVIIEK